MAVEVYSDNSVVMWEDGVAYDGDVRNLATFCSDNGAKIVPDVKKVPKQDTPVEEPTPVKEAVKPTEQESASTTSVEESTETTDNQTGYHMVDPIDAVTDIKMETVPAVTSVTEGSVHAVDWGSPQVRACIQHTDHMLFEMLKSRKAGRKPDQAWIDTMTRIRDSTGYTFEGRKVRKRGGTIEDLFEKFRNVPHEQLFTEDMSAWITNKSDLEAEERTTDVRMRTLFQFTRKTFYE